MDHLAVPSVTAEVLLREEGGRRVRVRGMRRENNSMATAGLEDRAKRPGAKEAGCLQNLDKARSRPLHRASAKQLSPVDLRRHIWDF